MRRPRRLRAILPATFVLLAAGFLLLGRAAVSDQMPPGDGAPPGTVAFFETGDGGVCPPGWVPATYATGRLVAGVTTSDQVGVTVGTPLADQEDRTHKHVYTGQVTLPYKSISAANGGNAQGAATGTYPVADMTDEAPSGLPFVQLLACEKQ